MAIRARFLDAGEAALVVEFGSTVEPEISDRVLALDSMLTQLALVGVLPSEPRATQPRSRFHSAAWR